MTYAWLVAGLTAETKAGIDRALQAVAPPDPEETARENAQTFGKLATMQGKGLA